MLGGGGVRMEGITGGIGDDSGGCSTEHCLRLGGGKREKGEGRPGRRWFTMATGTYPMGSAHPYPYPLGLSFTRRVTRECTRVGK
jgi:hypothetical protein